MILVDVLLVVAMLFFLFLPITDRKTARMKLCMLCTLLTVFMLSVARTPERGLQLAGIESTR
jgi:hypothetical protein